MVFMICVFDGEEGESAPKVEVGNVESKQRTSAEMLPGCQHRQSSHIIHHLKQSIACVINNMLVYLQMPRSEQKAIVAFMRRPQTTTAAAHHHMA